MDRQIEQLTSGRRTFMPLVFAAGEAFQFDWSEDWVVVAAAAANSVPVDSPGYEASKVVVNAFMEVLAR